MYSLQDTLNILGYNNSSNYFSKKDNYPENLEKYFYDLNELDSIKGIYFVQTRPQKTENERISSPLVVVSEVNEETEARELHKKIWNLGYIPFIIMLLPTQIRIYNGFYYSRDNDKSNILEKTDKERLSDVKNLLEKINSISIDTKSIWKSTLAEKITPETRVDKKLLANLKKLSKVLEETGLKSHLSNSLIGKFVYLKYLQHRNILTDKWMEKHSINYESVFSVDTTIEEFKNLVGALENKFNGKIFPIYFEKEKNLKDKHIQWTAAVFSGGEIDPKHKFPNPIIQLYLDFEAYNFEYIPVETLSMIYEQFIEDRKEKGAIYTPEFLADYLLSECELYKPISRETKVLDPACGSGVFLVITYRRLIEKERKRLGRELKIAELKELVVKNIFGVERELDACYVTEFSLILTLLHYADPSELHRLGNFKFPELHNNNIIHADFFDIQGIEYDVTIWKKEIKFDLIIGNPPWVEIKPAIEKKEKHVLEWMSNNKNQKLYPISGKRIAEAFAWSLTEFLATDGYIGLILPASSLVNSEARNFRSNFFRKNIVLRITNLANFRNSLFDGRGKQPAITIIYKNNFSKKNNYKITHVAPFSINLVKPDKPSILFIINDNDIQTIKATDAINGDTKTWKLAIWGTYIDNRIIEKIKSFYPITLEQYCEEKGFGKKMPREGIQLRETDENDPKKFEYMKELDGLPILSSKKLIQYKIKRRFDLYKSSLPKNEKLYLRKRGGKSGLKLNFGPHLVISPLWRHFMIFSNEDFIINPRQMAIAGDSEDPNSEKILRTLAVYLSSNIASYYLFFNVPQWGVYSGWENVITKEVRKIPTPNFTEDQIYELSEFHKSIQFQERKFINDFLSELNNKLTSDQYSLIQETSLTNLDDYELQNYAWNFYRKEIKTFNENLRKNLQSKIDKKIYSILKIPNEIRNVITEFFDIKLKLDTYSITDSLINKKANIRQLKFYAKSLRDELDSFMMREKHHRISILYSDSLIECKIDMTDEKTPLPITQDSIQEGNLTINSLMTEINQTLKKQFSQWVYIQRGLKLYDDENNSIYLYKQPRLIDWTKTQAILDAGEIIKKNLSQSSNLYEIN